MERLTGLLGFVLILGIAFALSNNRKAINYRLVASGLALQIALAVFILKTPPGKIIFKAIGDFITKVLEYGDKGGEFVFGVLTKADVLGNSLGAQWGFIFFFKITPTIIFVAVLVNIAYHLGIMQKFIVVVAKVVHAIMGVSGSEALSNAASAFVGQVEAQIMIKPYLNTMTKSELLASMAGSMACIAGGVMAVYISFGVPAEYLLAASIMAAPAALVIAKIVYPETEESQTKGEIKLEVKQQYSNLVDAISHGASDGLKVSLNVAAMLIGFLALIALIDGALGGIGTLLANAGMNVDASKFSLTTILGFIFSGFAWAMGVPSQDIMTAGSLMGTKMVANEFVAYSNLKDLIAQNVLQPKTLGIVSIALCGFANFGSIGIQIGGIGELAPERRADLASLGFRALICGTLASYLSATIAGILL